MGRLIRDVDMWNMSTQIAFGMCVAIFMGLVFIYAAEVYALEQGEVIVKDSNMKQGPKENKMNILNFPKVSTRFSHLETASFALG